MVEVMITVNDDETYTIMLDDPDNHIEINAPDQARANSIYTALIGNASNVH